VAGRTADAAGGVGLPIAMGSGSNELAGSSLEQARSAFQRGNYAQVRRLLRPLLETMPTGPEREQAEDLWTRIQPDPWLTYLLVLSLLLLVAVTAYAYSSGQF
jgi:hypothetical protein